MSFENHEESGYDLNQDTLTILGPVYTSTVEKSTGHEKRAFVNYDWSKMQLLTGGCLH